MVEIILLFAALFLIVFGFGFAAVYFYKWCEEYFKERFGDD